MAISALALGVDKIIAFLKAVTKTQKSILIRNTGIRIIFYIVKFGSKGVIRHLETLIDILSPLLSDDLLINKVGASNCIRLLAETSFP